MGYIPTYAGGNGVSGPWPTYAGWNGTIEVGETALIGGAAGGVVWVTPNGDCDVRNDFTGGDALSGVTGGDTENGVTWGEAVP